jgi:hypothetical protein
LVSSKTIKKKAILQERQIRSKRVYNIYQFFFINIINDKDNRQSNLNVLVISCCFLVLMSKEDNENVSYYHQQFSRFKHLLSLFIFSCEY